MSGTNLLRSWIWLQWFCLWSWCGKRLGIITKSIIWYVVHDFESLYGGAAVQSGWGFCRCKQASEKTPLLQQCKTSSQGCCWKGSKQRVNCQKGSKKWSWYLVLEMCTFSLSIFILYIFLFFLLETWYLRYAVFGVSLFVVSLFGLVLNVLISLWLHLSRKELLHCYRTHASAQAGSATNHFTSLIWPLFWILFKNWANVSRILCSFWH